MNSDLLEFTRRALERGIAPSEVERALAQAGWARPDIAAATSAFATVDFPIPVPKPKPYLSAREVFVYLLFFTSLYLSAFYLGALLFELIDRAFPDPLVNQFSTAFSADEIRWDISALIVAFPLFLFMFRHIEREIAKDPTKRASRPRKWLTYVTLFVAAAVILGDVITLVYNVLGGEYSIRFLLKVATVAFIGGGILLYFLADMRKEELL